MAYLYPRDPKDYPKEDGVCSERSLKYRIWYQGKPRKIGDLSIEELRGALLDAQNDLNLVCLKLYKVEVNAEEKDPTKAFRAIERINEATEAALFVAKRHRVFSEEEDELDADEAEARNEEKNGCSSPKP